MTEKNTEAFSPLILCLETATTNCSVALFRGDVLLGSRESNQGGFSHAEKLHVFIRETLEMAGVSPRSLDCIAVSRGPGSYTGLRIGVSAAKGLAYALGVPLVSVGTLEIMARGVLEQTGASYLVPMLDARRMEVYTAVYDRNIRQTRPVSALVMQPDSFSDWAARGDSVCFFGDGMDKCRPLLDAPGFSFLEGVFPSAMAMGRDALERYREQQWEDVAYFEPYYLKDFVGTPPASGPKR